MSFTGRTGIGRSTIRIGGVTGLAAALALVCLAAPVYAQEKTENAHVLVYRDKAVWIGKYYKPKLFCDNRKVAVVANGRYVILTVPPGRHTIGVGDKHGNAVVDASPGVTYYVRLIGDLISPTAPALPAGVSFSAEQTDRETALKKAAKLKPADSKRIIAPEIASTGPFAAE